jgi:LysM repeat protein
LVWLTVQILPGQADLVQGVRADVQQPTGAPIAAAPVDQNLSAAAEDAAVDSFAPAGTPLPAGPTATATPEGVEMLVLAAQEGATPVPCSPFLPPGWGAYTVQKGDHLTALARATGTTVREIAGANCLASDVIQIGQLLFVPLDDELPVEFVEPTAEPTNAPTPEPTVAPTEAPATDAAQEVSPEATGTEPAVDGVTPVSPLETPATP